MSLMGTVIRGVIVMDGNLPLPEGMRVRVVPDEELDDIPVPPSTERYEEHLDAIRKSIEETEAGINGVEARQFLKELAGKYGLPLEPGE